MSVGHGPEGIARDWRAGPGPPASVGYAGDGTYGLWRAATSPDIVKAATRRLAVICELPDRRGDHPRKSNA